MRIIEEKKKRKQMIVYIKKLFSTVIPVWDENSYVCLDSTRLKYCRQSVVAQARHWMSHWILSSQSHMIIRYDAILIWCLVIYTLYNQDRSNFGWKHIWVSIGLSRNTQSPMEFIFIIFFLFVLAMPFVIDGWLFRIDEFTLRRTIFGLKHCNFSTTICRQLSVNLEVLNE